MSASNDCTGDFKKESELITRKINAESSAYIVALLLIPMLLISCQEDGSAAMNLGNSEKIAVRAVEGENVVCFNFPARISHTVEEDHTELGFRFKSASDLLSTNEIMFGESKAAINVLTNEATKLGAMAYRRSMVNPVDFGDYVYFGDTMAPGMQTAIFSRKLPLVIRYYPSNEKLTVDTLIEEARLLSAFVDSVVTDCEEKM